MRIQIPPWHLHFAVPVWKFLLWITVWFGFHELCTIKNKWFIKWFGNERLYVISFKIRWVLWEFCRSFLSYDLLLGKSVQNPYTSRTNYNSRRYSSDFIKIQLKPSHSGGSQSCATQQRASYQVWRAEQPRHRQQRKTGDREYVPILKKGLVT